ncbi:MAG: hypothetical protein U5L75_02850 [Candidatus Campbellbacteria bacterium]|nr:hypothetical protein [Candidatus Campbellbacteria bacterium]
MNKPLYNILILTAVALVGLTGVSTTNAFYGDTETSQDNSFRASSLELGLTLNSSGADNRDTTVSSDGSRDLEYQLFKDSANGDFCSDLQVTISRDGSEIYNGSLAGFTQSGSFPLDSGDFDDFNFNFSVLDDEAQYDGQCTIAFTYNANQPGMPTAKRIMTARLICLRS